MWYAVEPNGRSGGLLLGWGFGVTIHQIMHTTYTIEVEFASSETIGKVWAFFVYASIRDRDRKE